MIKPSLALASRSPRRREMLTWLEIPFETLDGFIDETPLAGEDPGAHVRRIAEEKALAAGRQLEGDWTVIAADTVVVDQGEILGKPRDVADAARMLEQLSGREHAVQTGFILYNLKDGSQWKGACESRVRMRPFNAEEILDYVRSGDPLDKAGAYAIQNRDFHPVTDFQGCMANVMGLPLCHLKRELIRAGFVMRAEPAQICRDHLGYICPISARVLDGEEIG